MNITFITPCAGNGTRMLPWALMPKEMLPVKSQDGRIVPILLDLIMKAQDAGIDDFRIVYSENKKMIREYFTQDNSALTSSLYEKGKNEIAKSIKNIPRFSDDNFVIQQGPYGNVSPLLSLFFEMKNENGKWKIVRDLESGDKNFIPSENWIMYMFPDDLYLTAIRNEIQQVIDAHKKLGGSILPSKRAEDQSERDKYAFSDGEVIKGSRGEIIEVSKIVEKPGNLPIDSDLANVKGYLIHPDFRKFLRKSFEAFDQDSGEEFMIQNIIQDMIDAGYKFYAVKIEGEYHDTGNPQDYEDYWKSV